jgi:DNA (cytosine-5)-methyltransferase 1
MACDTCKVANADYEANYGLKPHGDIKDIDPSTLPPYDILCAGFPCQSFSNIGSHGGFNDSNGEMFFEIMRFVRINQPQLLLLENVKGLMSHDGGKTFATILNLIYAEGYHVTYKLLNCSDFGIPQSRTRLFIVASRIELPKFFEGMDKYEVRPRPTMSSLLKKDFKRDFALTIRCCWRRNPITSRHNWNLYELVDGSEYRLGVDDVTKLQGFDGFKFSCADTSKYKLLGNTIPTVLTRAIAKRLEDFQT